MLSAAVIQANSWWEPGTLNYFDVGDLSAILGFIALFFGMIFGVTRWWMKLLKHIIKDEIGIATAPIHPGANGGLSLPDVARKVSRLEDQMDIISDNQIKTNEILIKVLAQSVYIPDTAPMEVTKPLRARQRKNP
jgi:hypothetical protein